uniref:Sulfotransferase domain-containing protein n=1 Tax=Corethron hystrix TaxID=216773 RepID=A0A7S1BY57_9STRA|mmetsp:Transcript_43168/g.101225  ORF Transcript_43168/g.101225 Transcript_43168/m.101225 type:complete len:333 (+) Transcript_43168:44-1042(+)
MVKRPKTTRRRLGILRSLFFVRMLGSNGGGIILIVIFIIIFCVFGMLLAAHKIKHGSVHNALRVAQKIATPDHSINPESPFSVVPPISYPVIVVGMPKAGTTSIFNFFTCIQRRTSHQFCGLGNKLDECGTLMKENIESGRPPFHDLGNFEVYTQLDVERVRGNFEDWKGVCYFPQIEALEEIHLQYPQATLLLNKRNVDAWISSVHRHRAMDIRMGFCDITGFPPVERKNLKREMLQNLYESQVQRVRNFVKKYPSHRLVEVQIDDNGAGKQMVENFGGKLECWNQTNTHADVQEMVRAHAMLKLKRSYDRNENGGGLQEGESFRIKKANY